MKKENIPRIFSSKQRGFWAPREQFIWIRKNQNDQEAPAVSIMKTLLDQPRWLQAYHLYDERGSHLFEEICELPEYYLTRTENSILAGHADQIIAAAPVECIVELGAGSSQKTMHLLREQVKQRRGGTFAPIDVSLTGLAASREIVSKEFPQLTFTGLCARYEEGIAGIEKTLPSLFVFLGSTVGNFNHSEFNRFFHYLSQCMGPSDFLLLGIDRTKEAEIIERAYDDSRGLTADFILNVFSAINRLVGSDFDAAKMRYHSRYNREWQQVEMHAVSTATQEIHFPVHAESFIWEKGDRILVEISRKFDPARLQKQLRFFALDPVAHFTDLKEWFSLLLFRKSSV